MLYTAGRLLQLTGLVVAPLGIAANVARPQDVSLWGTLMVAGLGIGLFTLGWLVQQVARPR